MIPQEYGRITRHGLPEMAHVVGSVDRSVKEYSARCTLSQTCLRRCADDDAGLSINVNNQH